VLPFTGRLVGAKHTQMSDRKELSLRILLG